MRDRPGRFAILQIEEDADTIEQMRVRNRIRTGLRGDGAFEQGARPAKPLLRRDAAVADFDATAARSFLCSLHKPNMTLKPSPSPR